MTTEEFAENVRIDAERKTAKAKEYAEQSRERLKKIITTKIKTSFIGALSEFEKSFGFLWGCTSPTGLTEDQSKILVALDEAGYGLDFFRGAWDLARTNVLNNGNNQIRAIGQEISHYSMTWDRYHLVLPVKPRTEGN